MEGFTPKKKEDVVSTVENNESIQNQIEEQVQNLNPKLDALKADIDAMGGIEGLNNKIASYSLESGFIKTAFESSFGTLTGGFNHIMDNKAEVAGQSALAVGGVMTMFVLVDAVCQLATGSYNPNALGQLFSSISPEGAAVALGGAVAGMATLGGFAGTIMKIESWWENRKMKSLKNKAEVAGMA